MRLSKKKIAGVQIPVLMGWTLRLKLLVCLINLSGFGWCKDCGRTG